MISVSTLSIATVGAAFIALGTVGSAQAATLVINTFTNRFDVGADNQGWWSPTVGNSNKNDSYFVGEYSSGKPVRNFFTFDVSSIKNEVLEATLELQRYKGIGGRNLTIEWFDVSTSAKTLNKNSGTSSKIFNDLGTGRSYGTFNISTSGNSSDILSFPLNSRAVDAIDEASTFFSIGGALDSSSFRKPGRQALFGSSDGVGVQRLRVEVVPEPSFIVGVLGFGVFGLNSMLKRRQKIRK